MRVRNRMVVTLALAIATGMGAMVGAGPASASINKSTNDDTAVFTSNNCGLEAFIDYGFYKPTNRFNDDYLQIRDRCADGHGVKAYAWQNGTFLGARYNGKGKGTLLEWDPFINKNVKAGDTVKLKVCLANGSSGTVFDCLSVAHKSVDG